MLKNYRQLLFNWYCGVVKDVDKMLRTRFIKLIYLYSRFIPNKFIYKWYFFISYPFLALFFTLFYAFFFLSYIIV